MDRLCFGLRLAPFSFHLRHLLGAGAIAAVGPTLAQQVVVLPEVTVTASPTVTENSGTYAAQSSTVGGKLALPLKETPRSVSVLGRQQLDDQNLTTIDGALEKATGVYVRTEGDMSDGPFFYARGFAMSVAENGMPFDTTYYGGGLDTSVYDRIEVLRGPDGLMQGQGQLGGTVNLVRKRPLPYDQRKVHGMAGSNRHLSGSLDVSQVLNAAGTLRGRAVLSAENSDGFVSHTGREQYLGYGILEADLAPSTMVSIHLLAQRTNTNPYFGGLYDGEQYTPRGQYGGARWSRYAFDRQEAGLGVRHRFNADWSLSADVHYRRYDNQKRFAFHNPHPAFGSNGGQSALINRATWFDGNQRTADVHLNGRFRTGARTHEVVVGANVERYDFRNWTRNAPSVGMWTFGNAEVPYVELERPDSSDSHVSQTGIYVQGNVELADGLNLHLGGRYSKYRSERTSPTGVHSLLYDESNVFTPYGGLVWKLNDQVSVYASYADIFRPQSAGSEDASGKLLDPLVGKQVEVGANMALFQDRVNAHVAVFDARDTNRAISDPLNPGHSIAAGKVESRGLELELAGRVTPHWDVVAGYTYTRTQYSSGYEDMTGLDFNSFSPRHTFKLWSHYTLGAGSALPGAKLGAGVRYYSESQLGVAAPFVFTARQGGYFVVDARLGYQVNRQTEVSVSVSNLFDKHYVTSPGIRAFYGEPRRVMLKASYTW